MALPRRLFEDTITLSLTSWSVLMVCLPSLDPGMPPSASGTSRRTFYRQLLCVCTCVVLLACLCVYVCR